MSEEIQNEAANKIDETYKENKSFGKGILVGALCTLAVFLLIGAILTASIFGGSKALLNSATKMKIDYLNQIINKYYYKDVDAQKLREGMYDGLFEGLDDPYADYYTKEEYEDLMINLTGKYCGIGALLGINKEGDTVTVMRVYDGSPAKEAGLKEGDLVLSADGFTPAQAKDLTEFVEHIRGEEGSKVLLEIQRDETKLQIEIERANIDYPTVDYQMLDNNVAYIEISSFTDGTAGQFKAAVEALEAQGMESMIVDLRSNGGGLLDSVVEILDYVLPEGIVVYTVDKDGSRKNYTSAEKSQLNYPMVVLTSEQTASAAEIFSGAIRDYKYGTLVGTKTFGKGIVQSTIQLADGSAIKLTTSTYYTPSGDCIHEKGIAPDVELEYEFLGDEDDEYTIELDNQVQKAIEILESKTQL